MKFPSEEFVVPKELPRDENGTDDVYIRAISKMLESMAFKIYYSALRFEDDGQPHVPTYGLRLAADELSRAAYVVFRESIPLSTPIKICLRTHIETVAVGIEAFARSLEHDWDMVKAKCRLHCKTCSALCSVKLIEGIHEVLLEAVQSKKHVKLNAKKKKEMKSVVDLSVATIRDYRKHVSDNGSFADSHKFWDTYAQSFEKMAEYFYELL